MSPECQLLIPGKVLMVNYRNDPKFLDRLAWANSVDPDQTAPPFRLHLLDTLLRRTDKVGI